MALASKNWWQMDSEEVMKELETGKDGLSQSAAAQRLSETGPNSLPSKKLSWWKILLHQFTNGLLLILLFAALLALALGDRIEATVILSIIVINLSIAFFQEFKAENSLEKLKEFIAPKARVMRGGQVKEVDARTLVIGDIVLLHIGDMVPADIRLIGVEEFSLDEAALTGESEASEKTIERLETNSKEPLELKNMSFMGTVAVSGSAQGIVVATGKNTYIGKTAEELSLKEPEADFQKNIRKFSKMLIIIMISLTLFIFVTNSIQDKDVFNSFLFAIALAVGITPEALPIIITITLSNGALRMAKKKVVVKKLAAVEDLGNIDTLCCDKTGTLTEGTLNLEKFISSDGQEDEDVLLRGLLCTKIYGTTKHQTYGNPLDEALWKSPLSKKAAALARQYEIIDENEFDFERRRMSVIVTRPKEKTMLIAKGTCEGILSISTSIRLNGTDRKMTAKDRQEMGKKCSDYEAQGYRVITIGIREILASKESTKDDEHDLTFIGFLIFLDPPRSTVKETLKTMNTLGVRIKIITGDGEIITRTICAKVGLKIINDTVILGDELSNLSDKEIFQYADKYNVFARVNPDQKYRLVSALNREGHVVGYLGDGVNDAPALKAADVGISVNTGTDIAKEAADIIMLKKTLHVLAEGIIEGRKTFQNITKYILNTISANLGNMVTLSAASLFLKFLPLLPGQILLNNFLSDVPLLTVSTDNVDLHVLRRPKRWNIGLIFRFMVFFGLISTFFDLTLILPLTFFWHVSPELFRTAWFVESTLSEMLVTFIIRTRLPFWKSAPSSTLLLASLASILIGIALPALYFGQKFFYFVPLPVSIWLLITAVLIGYLASTEIAKHIFFRRYEE